MKVIESLEKLEQAGLSNLVVALGNFDGVHLGHRKLLNEALVRARELNAQSAVVTFEPHPLKLLAPDKLPKLLTTVDQRLEHFSELGIDLVILLPFTKAMSALTPRQFAASILLEQVGTVHACVGFNYTFGCGGNAGPEELTALGKELGFGVTVVGPQSIDGVLVSSTQIRTFMEHGDIEQARKYLGYWPKLRGTVVGGERRGRTLGFPTANVEPSADMLVPCRGVYAAWAKFHDRLYPAMVNIGLKPTFRESTESTIEAHLLDFNENIYDEQLEIIFRQKLRNEQKFADVEDLLRQLRLDARETCKVLKYIRLSDSLHTEEKMSI